MRLTRALAGAGGWASGLGTVAFLIILPTDVGRRLLGLGGLPGAIEYSEVLLVFVALLSLAQGQEDRSHVAVTLVSSRLPEGSRKVIYAVAMTITLGVVIAVAVATGIRAIDSFSAREFRFGTARVAVWPARLAVPVGLTLLALSITSSIVRTFREPGHERDDDAPVKGSPDTQI